MKFSPWLPQKGPLLISQVLMQPVPTVALWKDVTHAQFIPLKFSSAQLLAVIPDCFLGVRSTLCFSWMFFLAH